MVILKKIKASTLMETLVATVLIVVVFIISSMILNNVFSNSVKNSTTGIEEHLNELCYLYRHEKLIIPYQDDFNDWQISVIFHKGSKTNNVVFEASNSNTHKNLTKTIRANQE